MKHLSIGARARRFVLELPLDTPDGFGGVIRTYAPGPQLWGAIEMVYQAERERAASTEQAVTHRVRLRWRDGVTGATDPDGAKRDLVCLVEEVSP
jgi:SPP1 family predicted phage head-tail adaptor